MAEHHIYAIEVPMVPPVQSASFESWFVANKEWLQPYAAFCFLRDLFGTAKHWKWGSLSHPSQKVRKQIPYLAIPSVPSVV